MDTSRTSRDRGIIHAGFHNAIYDVLSLVFIQTVKQWERQTSAANKIDPNWSALYRDITSIMGVCNHWRSTILDTPRVWVNLIYDSNDATNSKVRYFKAAGCFERTGATPLNVWLKNGCSPNDLADILSRITRNRLGSLKSMSVPFGIHWSLPMTINDTVIAVCASVRYLTLYAWDKSVEQYSPSVCGFLSLFCGLRRLDIRDVRFIDGSDIQSRGMFFEFPCVRCLYLTSSMQGVQHSLYLIRCPNLRELTIRIRSIRETSFPLWQCDIATRAEHFALSGHVNTSYMKMALALVPNVQTIRLHDFNYCGREPYDALRQLSKSVRERQLIPVAQHISLSNVQPCFVWIALALGARGRATIGTADC